MDVFAVLAEPNRRSILACLQSGERSVGELVEELPLTQPAASKHLKVLRTTGFVTSRAVAQRRMYQLQPERFVEVDAWLEPYRRLWSNRLDALTEHLDRMDDE